MADPISAPLRTAAAPPTPQEIERKLGSPSLPPNHMGAPSPALPSLSSSLDSIGALGLLERRGSATSRRTSTACEEESDDPSLASFAASGGAPPRISPPQQHARQHLALQSISETEDNLGVSDAEDSDASSLGGGGDAGDARSPQFRARPYSPRDRDSNLAPVRTSVDSANTGGLSENVALKSGYLMKKGQRRKAWKKRWVVLRGGQLAMYKNDKEYRLSRLIPLAEIHAVAPIELKKHQHAFGIVTPRRTYYVKADSADAVTSWCSVIERAKAEYNARTTVASVDTPTAGASPAQTPRQLSFSGGARPEPEWTNPPAGSTSFAINIPGSAPPSAAYAPASYASTSASSFNTTAGAAPQQGSGVHAPPNSVVSAAPAFAHSPSAAVEDPLGAGLDARLSQLDLAPALLAPLPVPVGSPPAQAPGVRPAAQRRPSARSDTLAPVPELPMGRGRSGSNATRLSVSPGGGAFSAMSSSDEDEAAAVAPPPAPQPHPQLQPEDPNKVILAGYLMKQGKRKNWRKRWFVLQSGMLMYSRSHMDSKHSRQIPLSSILDAIEAPSAFPLASPTLTSPTSPVSLSAPADGEAPAPDNTFKIITPGRTFLVCAPSEEDEIKWLAALQCLVARRTHAHALTAPPPPAAAAAPPPVRPGMGMGQRPPHGRQRSVTDAARQAVKDVERRFHPAASAS